MTQPVINKEAADHYTRARASLLFDNFFYGRLAMYLKPVQTARIPTMAVDGRHVFYNPEFILTLKPHIMKSAVVHEISHCIYEHMARRGSRNPQLWNCAGDYAINQDIRDAGFTLGAGWLIDPKYVDMSAEHIYDLLSDAQGKNPNQSPPEAFCEILSPQGESPDPQDTPASGAEVDLTAVAAEWRVAVAEAAAAARPGDMPGRLKHAIDESVQNKVPWREVLRQFVTACSGVGDYTWSRPNRRFLHHGLYLPSLYSEAMGCIDVVIDTSGSIDAPTLSAFGAEVRGVVEAVRPERTRVIYCDSQINHIDVFERGEDLTFDMHGGGGTDFRPPFDMIKREGTNPVALLYLTDLYGSFPAEQDFPVLWCATTDIKGPHGQTVRLDL